MLLRIDGAIYVEVPDDTDPETVAQDFDSGFESAMEGFSGMYDYDPVVEKASVREISLVGEEEKIREGLDE